MLSHSSWWSIRAIDVMMVVEAAIARYGMPEDLRVDNGPEIYRLLHPGLAKRAEN
jgi:hypothetical protein